MDSDSSSELLLSKFLSEHHTLISSDWYYSTELRLLYTQLINVPLFMITSDWTVIRAASGAILSILLILSYFFMMKGTSISSKWIWLTSPLLIIPLSRSFSIMVTGNSYYIPHICITFIYIGLFFRLIYHKEKYTRIHSVVLNILFFALSFYLGIAGNRYIIITILPLLFACIWLLYRSPEFTDLKKELNKQNRDSLFKSLPMKQLKYCFGGLALVGIGYAANTNILAKIFSFADYTKLKFDAFTTEPFFDKMASILKSFAVLFGYNEKSLAFSFQGIVNIISACLIILLIVLLIKSLKRTKKDYAEQQTLMLFIICNIIVNTFVFIFLLFEPRYLVPVVIFYIPLLAVYLNLKNYKLNKILITGLIYAAVFCLSANMFISASESNLNKSRSLVIQYLEENRFELGYSTYWNAAVTTELSKDTIQMVPIQDFMDMEQFKWMTPKDYFDPAYYNGGTFILLTSTENKQYKDAAILKQGILTYTDKNFVVYFYSSDKPIKDAIAANSKG
jgi:hypothetical protein